MRKRYTLPLLHACAALLHLAHCNGQRLSFPAQAPGMLTQVAPSYSASAPNSNTTSSCSGNACQGGSRVIEPSDLAVLNPGFTRELDTPWRTTVIFTDNGTQSTVGDEYDIDDVNFLIFGDPFAALIGDNPFAQVLAQRDEKFAHEGAVYLEQSREVYFSSSPIADNSSEQGQVVKLFAVGLDNGTVREIEPEDPIPYANGAVAYNDGLALVAQGQRDGPPGGVLFLNPYTGEWYWLLNNWFGLAFNSPNDIVYTSADQALWFTDPSYAANQGFKDRPQLGEFIWKYIPGGPPARVVADGFVKPNGLALSPDQQTLYVSDSGFASGNKQEDQEPKPNNPHTIYAFDITDRSGGSFLTNKRVFAVCDTGIPDGIKLDSEGNVYSGCGDGLNVWAPSGDLIGKIYVEGGVANFCFAGNSLVLLAETKVLKINLNCREGCTRH